MNLLRLLLLCLFAFCFSACAFAQSQSEPSSAVATIPDPTLSPTETADPKVIEVTVQATTPEPTPTTAVCTAIPDDLNIEIQGRGPLHGVIEITGLQPGDKPIFQLTGQRSPSDLWRMEKQPSAVLDENGHYRTNFDFRTWDSIEGYTFAGKLIHKHGVACFDLELPLTDYLLDEERVYEPVAQPILPLADYPPSDIPYYIQHGDIWFVHSPDGKLLAFAPVAPAYKAEIDVEECRIKWDFTNQRFIDPCSGDEWSLLGKLDLANSSELWSQRNLDQYAINVMQEKAFVQRDQVIKAQSLVDPPLAADSQFGITVTAVTTKFTPTATLIDTIVQVDPVWQMDPAAFPPQQALTYPTFPDSMIDDHGQVIPTTGIEGGFAVVDSNNGGLQQTAHNYWEAIPSDTQVLTATLTVELLSLYSELQLPLAWDDHQEGDLWAVDIPVEIGHATIHINEVEWLNTTEDGRARLRIAATDASPEGIKLTCLHIDVEDPWQNTCANFDGVNNYAILAQPGEDAAVHLRAVITFIRPFQLQLDVNR